MDIEKKKSRFAVEERFISVLNYNTTRTLKYYKNAQTGGDREIIRLKITIFSYSDRLFNNTFSVRTPNRSKDKCRQKSDK